MTTTRTSLPSCTLDLIKVPPIETDCTFHEATTTATVFTDCGGCELQTKVMGLGLVSSLDGHCARGLVAGYTRVNDTNQQQPCRKVHTATGTATETVTACQLRVTNIVTVTAYEESHD